MDFNSILVQAKNILIVTAHPDDSSIMLGGCVQAAVKNLGNDHVFASVATDGEAGQNYLADKNFVKNGGRLAEELASLERLGAKNQNIFFAHLPDGEMSKKDILQKYSTNLAELCQKYKISTLVTLGEQNDGHPDHAATHFAAQNACDTLADVELYALNGSHNGQYILGLTSSTSSQKFAAASLHKSQYSAPGWLAQKNGAYSLGLNFAKASNFYPTLEKMETFDRIGPS